MSVLLLFLGWVPLAGAWEIRGPEGVPTDRSLDAAQVFSMQAPPWTAPQIAASTGDLGAAAQGALTYLQAHEADDPAAGPGMFSELGVDAARVQATLAFVARIAAEDAARPGATQRLQDPAFLTEHFDYYRWSPDVVGAQARSLQPSGGRIRLTRYYVPTVDSSTQRTEAHRFALYADPGAPARTQYTRQEVLAGVYEDGGAAAGQAQALVWFTETQVHEALMQGTIATRSLRPDGSRAEERLFNVHVHNGLPYKPGYKSQAQERLWYFRQVDGVLGWSLPGADKIPLQDQCSVAGDIYNLGLGKVLALDHPGPDGGTTVRLAILGDTGGAFQPNLFQLDLLGGSHTSRESLYTATKDIPSWVGAGVLLLKQP